MIPSFGEVFDFVHRVFERLASGRNGRLKLLAFKSLRTQIAPIVGEASLPFRRRTVAFVARSLRPHLAMCRTLSSTLCLLLVASTLAGCAMTIMQAERPTVPDRLDGQGLMVAEIRYPDLLWGRDVHVDISGSKRGILHNNYAVIVLPPGRYALESVTAITGESTDQFGGVTVKKTQYATRPIRRGFDIKPGKVTNLGLILFIAPDKKSPAQLYAVDNTAAMRHYLKKNYPRLYAGLGNDAFLLADGPYVPVSGLADLRRQIVTSTLRISHAMEAGYSDVDYAVGPAGSVARLVRRNNDIIDARSFDTGTLAPVIGGSVAGERRAFLTGDGKLFVLERERLRTLAVPVETYPVKVHLFGANGLALADGRMRIWTSLDDGEHWQSHAGFVHDLPELVDDLKIEAVNADRGFYLYSTYSGRHQSVPPAIAYSAYTNIDFRRIAPPPGIDDVARLVDKQAGLFLVPPSPVFGSDKLHFQRADTTTWETFTLPGWLCNLQFKDETGTDIWTGPNCGNQRSTDFGRTWSKR